MKNWIVLTVAGVGAVLVAWLALREPQPVEVRAVRQAPAPVVVQQPTPNLAILDDNEMAAVAPPPGDIDPDTPHVLADHELMDALAEFGFGNLESLWREWARKRGYPVVDASGARYYDQPYDQYDNLTLEGLADNGDMWAAQILAQRIARDNPAEAIELYRQAAVQGSVYAMNEMAALYNRIADKRREVEFKSGDLALEQVYAMRDAPVSPEVSGYAWTAVAAMAGSEPMFGDMNASQLERRMSDEQVEEACSLAQGIYDDLLNQRAARSLGDYDRSPPPMVYADAAEKSRCGLDIASSMNLDGCREMVVESEDKQVNVWLCGD